MENMDNPNIAYQHDGGVPSSQSGSYPVPPAVRRLRSSRAKAISRRPLTAIAVHAGAGFHSHANESFHLKACNDAAQMAMKFLNAGASATEAVTIAIKVLEDLEITNAGYGSNLCIDGTVECDASIVDHLGRSGACGAVPNIRNPICLAKTLLDKSLEPLSLRRVPPSFLVGQGAVKFARHHGFEVLPNENLISKNAGDRFHRWQNELRRVATDPASPPKSRKPTSVDSSAARAESASSVDTYHSGDRATMVSGFYNEAQSGFPSKDFGVLEGASYSQDGPPRQGIQGPGPSRQSTQFDTPDLGILDEIQLPRMPASTYEDKSLGRDLQQRRSRYTWSKSKPSEGDGADGTTLGDGPSSPSISNQVSPRNVQSSRETPTRTSVSPTLESAPTRHKRSFGEYAEQAKDSISDTVGAIAIDSMGRIAAGSSSGGIGMKHRGRVGPAALVRVGSAVIPAHPKDPLDVSVAAVASGTGEHIATTMASQRCAERLIRGSRQGEFGEDLYDGDDHDILHAFIQEDFMKHPGVQGMTTTGALGIIAVKMSKTAYYFYFGHNTESFALATMGSTDREPQCLMSRLNPDGDTKISVGARRIRRQ